MRPAFQLPSPETGTNYGIWVESPDPAVEPGPWPLMIFMDGDLLFQAAVEGYRQARARKEVPPLLLAGVGYGVGIGQPGNYRVRDYTPTPLSTEEGSGGADRFLEFLTRTLSPELRRRYPLRAGVRGLGGHSLGSLLVLHALFQAQPLFTHHLVSAPSLWWDERAMLTQAAELRKTQTALPAKAFFSVGAEDTASMTGDLDLLERQLKAQPFAQLTAKFMRFPGRNHYDVVPEACAVGLKTLFPEGR